MIKNIAHRGYSKAYPENTMLAFKKAIEAGCDAIELDIHQSKDGHLMIFHDEELLRTTKIRGSIRDYTMQELRNMDASMEFTGIHENNGIPALEEYFEFIKEQEIRTVIELKNNVFMYPDMEKNTIEMIEHYGLKENVILCSFSQKSVAKCQEIDPAIKTALITDRWLYKGGSIAKSLGADFIHPRHFFLQPWVLREMKRAGILIQPWTVDNRRRMRSLIRSGVHGIITNDPKLLQEVKTALQKEKRSR